MEKSNKTERNKIIDETFNNFANSSIKIMSEALAEKDAIISYWRNKAYILANKNKLCHQHEIRENERNFNNLGVSFEDYIKDGVDCADCSYNKLKGNK